jgi:hypothetical protein
MGQHKLTPIRLKLYTVLEQSGLANDELAQKASHQKASGDHALVQHLPTVPVSVAKL